MNLTKSLVVQVKTRSVQFSKASPKLASQALDSLCLGTGGRLRLPDLEQYMPSSALLTPYEWGPRESENQASSRLLPLLKSWVVTDARPAVSNMFMDVQRLASNMPIELFVENVANFKGMPDMIVAGRAIGREEEASPTTSAAVVAVDWKTPAALSKTSEIMAIGHVHALAFAQASSFLAGKPVFFTDLRSGFRSWIVLDSTLYYLHPDDRLLTLAEGVALIRYFLAAQGDGRVVSREAGSLVCALPSRGAVVDVPSAPPPAYRGGVSGGVGGRVEGTGHRGGGGVHTSGHIVSRDVCPESNGSDDDDDFSAVVKSIAAAREAGGGVPHLVFG